MIDLRLATTSPFEFVVVSLLMTKTFEFSINFPFSNVIDVCTGEFCTNIFVLGKPEPFELFVTCSVMDPLEFELGNVTELALDGSSNDVDLIPFDDVEVVTFGVDVPLDFMSLCLVELFGEF